MSDNDYGADPALVNHAPEGHGPAGFDRGERKAVRVADLPHLHNEEAAYAYVEARIWPEGPVCPRCGTMDRIGKLNGKSTRAGVHKCYRCRKPFIVKTGTIFEDSKLPMVIWLQAMFVFAAIRSVGQLAKITGTTYRTAEFIITRLLRTMDKPA